MQENAQSQKQNYDVIIPTYKPDEKCKRLLDALEKQEVPPRKIILINTEEALFPKSLLEGRNPELYLVKHIKKEEFDHAYARNLGVSFSDAPFFLCMTEDAVPKDGSCTRELLEAFSWEEKIGAVYARQLTDEQSSFDEVLSRSFNYGTEQRICGIEQLPKLGIKCFFQSNVCCMYKKDLFQSLGGFSEPSIFNEDMIYAARMQEAGGKTAYCPRAEVWHSHHFSAMDQFHRNFDLGVSHRDYREIFSKIPAEKEGMKYLKRSIGKLWKEKKALWILPFFYKTAFRFLGYQLGKRYHKLPKSWVYAFTVNPQYFRKKFSKEREKQ